MDAALLGAVAGRLTGIMLLAPAGLSAGAPSQASASGLNSVDRFVLVDTTVERPPPGPDVRPPAPGPPAPPTPTVPRVTPPTVKPATPRPRGKLSALVTKSDLRAPFRFRVSGRLTLPKGITKSVGCKGRVSVQIKRGTSTISTRRVSLSKDCTYSLRVTFSNARRFAGVKRLKFTARFVGNTRVGPATAPARFGRVRR